MNTFNSLNSLTQSLNADNFFKAETIDLLHYWRVLMRSKLLIAIIGLCAALVSAFLVVGKDDVYSATATVLIESNKDSVTSIQEIYGRESQSREYFNSQFELFKNRGLAENVISDLNLLTNPEFMPEPSTGFSLSGWIKGLELSSYIPGYTPSSKTIGANGVDNSDRIRLLEVLEQFGDQLFINPIANTNLVNVSFQAKDPQLAADVANSIANAYIERSQEQRLSASQEATQWLNERLVSLRRSVNDAEDKLQAFLEKEGLIDIDGVASLNIQELDELTTQSVNASQSKAEAESVYNQIKLLRNPSTQDLLAFPAILNHEAVQDIRQRANIVDQEIAELGIRYGKNHPRMIALASERQLIQTGLSEQVQQVLSTLENNYQTATDNERTTLARLARSKSELQVVNSKGFDLRELERAVVTNQELYDLFFTRVRETDQTNNFKSSNALVVDLAYAAPYPSGTRRSIVVMMALVVGLIIGAVVAILMDLLNNTIKSHSDVEERLRTSILGVVPYIKRKVDSTVRDHAYLGFIDDIHSAFSESIRTIRASITLSSLDKPYKIIEITSSVPNEGKSTLSLNLASAMGQLNNILLIDTDLRRPSLAKSIAIPENTLGLADYLAGNINLDDCLHPFEEANITVMPAGQMIPNPQEMLSSLKFKTLLEDLGQKFDHIILDAPPTKTVMDSLILGAIAHATVYVVKSDSTPVNVIKGELARLDRANVNVIGVVLNQVKINKNSDENYGGYYDSEGYSLNSQAG